MIYEPEIYDEDQNDDIRLLLDERAQMYSPDQMRILSKVAIGRTPRPGGRNRGAVLAMAAAVVVVVGFVSLLISENSRDNIATVGDVSVTSASEVPEPQSDPAQSDTADVVVGEDSAATTTSAPNSGTFAPTSESTPSSAESTVVSPATTATPPATDSPATDSPGTDSPATTATPPTTAPPTTATPPTVATTTTVEPTTSTTLETPVADIERPDSCYTQTDGVEVFDSDFEFATSYAFFDSNGDFFLSTSSLGPADDIEEEEGSIEWTSDTYGYQHAEVYSVAAEGPNGAQSDRVVCRRHILLD